MSNVSDRFYVRTSETDFNRLTKSGYYFGKLTQNTPDGTTDSNWIVEVQAFDNSTGWTFQRATRSSDKAIFTRIQDNGMWSDWEALAKKSDLTGLDATLSIREENGGVIASFGSKDSKHGIYIGVGPNGVNANYKLNGEWKKAFIIATKS